MTIERTGRPDYSGMNREELLQAFIGLSEENKQVLQDRDASRNTVRARDSVIKQQEEELIKLREELQRKEAQVNRLLEGIRKSAKEPIRAKTSSPPDTLKPTAQKLYAILGLDDPRWYDEKRTIHKAYEFRSAFEFALADLRSINEDYKKFEAELGRKLQPTLHDANWLIQNSGRFNIDFKTLGLRLRDEYLPKLVQVNQALADFFEVEPLPEVLDKKITDYKEKTDTVDWAVGPSHLLRK